MDFLPPFGYKSSACINVSAKELTFVEYIDENGFQKMFYCWGSTPQMKTYKEGHKDHVVELDFEWSEEVGFIDKGVELLVEQAKKIPKDFLSVGAYDPEGQQLLVNELRKKDKISIGLLKYKFHEYSEVSNEVPTLIEHKWYYGVDPLKRSLVPVTDQQLNKEFLALNHQLKNPEVLRRFTGKSLAIGCGNRNGYDYTFVLDNFKKWFNGETVQFSYLQVSGGSIPSEEVMKWLEEHAEEIFHGDVRDSPAEFIFRFKREVDGNQSEILICKDNFGWIVDADEGKRGFFFQFDRDADPQPESGSLQTHIKIK